MRKPRILNEERKVSSINGAGKLDFHKHKKKIGSLSYFT